MMISCHDASATDGRSAPIEVFTGIRRRRPCSDEEKERIVAESYGGNGGTVCDVALRNGNWPSELFARRRQLRRPMMSADVPLYLPAVIEEAAVPAAVAASCPVLRPRWARRSAD
jgi:transposase